MFFKETLLNVLASWSKLLSLQMTSWLLGTSQTTVITTKCLLLCCKQHRNVMSSWNFDKLHYKQNEVHFFGKTYNTSGHKPARSKVSPITAMPSPTNKKKFSLLLAWLIICPGFCQDCQSLQNQLENCQRTKYLLIGDLNIRQPSNRWRKKFFALLCWHITTWCLFTSREACLFCK